MTNNIKSCLFIWQREHLTPNCGITHVALLNFGMQLEWSLWPTCFGGLFQCKICSWLSWLLYVVVIKNGIFGFWFLWEPNSKLHWTFCVNFKNIYVLTDHYCMFIDCNKCYLCLFGCRIDPICVSNTLCYFCTWFLFSLLWCNNFLCLIM